MRERAVRLLQQHANEHEAQWAAMQSIAGKIGCSAETLRSWGRQAERDMGRRPDLTTDEQARLKVLERENREFRRPPNEIRRKESAYFAQAAGEPRDRRGT